MPSSTLFCTGHYCHFVASSDNWHGLFGHINTSRPDQHSLITGYGQHQRVVVFNNHIRIDLKWILPEPSLAEIHQVISHYQSTDRMQLAEIHRDENTIEYELSYR